MPPKAYSARRGEIAHYRRPRRRAGGSGLCDNGEPGGPIEMPSRDTPTLAAEPEALQFAWDARRFNQRVLEVPQVMRAGPVDPSIISLAFGAPDPVFFPAAGL